MKKSTKTTITAAIAAVALAGMYASYTTNGDIDFTDNVVAKVVTSAYKASENAAVNGWKATENFFVSTLFQQEGETVQETKVRLQENKDKNNHKKAD